MQFAHLLQQDLFPDRITQRPENPASERAFVSDVIKSSGWNNRMNPHRLVPSVSRWLLSTGCLMLAVGQAAAADFSKFRRIEPQFISALGNPAASSGNNAQSWGFWSQDPGPRACKLDHYPRLKATGQAPAQWKFDASDWWLE